MGNFTTFTARQRRFASTTRRLGEAGGSDRRGTSRPRQGSRDCRWQRAKTSRSTFAATTRILAKWFRGDCWKRLPAPNSRNTYTAAAGWNLPSGCCLPTILSRPASWPTESGSIFLAVALSPRSTTSVSLASGRRIPSCSTIWRLAFASEGWSVKKLIREIMLSQAYQMASVGAESAEQRDPLNLLLHRSNVRRLEGEAIRDALLAVSGRLDPTQFGPPVPIHLSPFMEGRGRPEQSGPLDGDGRRSIYVEVRRNFLSPFMVAFDTPQPASTTGRRNVSNVPAQALIMMNDPFVFEQCQIWATRALAEADRSPEDRITRPLPYRVQPAAFGGGTERRGEFPRRASKNLRCWDWMTSARGPICVMSW